MGLSYGKAQIPNKDLEQGKRKQRQQSWAVPYKEETQTMLSHLQGLKQGHPETIWTPLLVFSQ